MNAVTLLNELYFRNIALQVIGANRLRFEAMKGSLTEDLIFYLREHKPAIIAILGAHRSLANLLGSRCPFCHLVGMRIEEIPKSERLYFDTRCVHCGEIVETLVLPSAILLSCSA
jgi:hypothetical protein